jgi:hypothetical protein
MGSPVSPTRTDGTARCALCGSTKALLVVRYPTFIGPPTVLCEDAVQCSRRLADEKPRRRVESGGWVYHAGCLTDQFQAAS